jgi:hypothetical protein
MSSSNSSVAHSSSNAAGGGGGGLPPLIEPQSPVVVVTPGCEKGFLAPPTVDMVPAELSPVEQIRRVYQLTEAYLVYSCLVAYPSPSFILPESYRELLAPLEPATPAHGARILRSINNCIHSESFFWLRELKNFDIPTLTKESKDALCAVSQHWDCHSVFTRTVLGLHDYLMEIPDLDFDPSPPPPFDPSGFCTMRCESGPPSGSDDFIYNGSYLVCLERCFGYEYGQRNWETYKEEGGTPGFIRTFARERLLPLLTSQLDKLVAQYKAHPITQLGEIIRFLGAPRVRYSLNPPSIQEEPTSEDKEVIDFWTPICEFRSNHQECMGLGMRTLLMDTAESIPALKSDAATSLALDMMARIASSSGKVLNFDEASLISSFVGTRLPDTAPELRLRPRHPMHTTEGIDATAVKTAALAFGV